MFKTYCGDCGNSWYIGNPRTCTCPWKDALKPKWVGLTEAESETLVFERFTDGKSAAKAVSLVRAIEAKLKEKNT